MFKVKNLTNSPYDLLNADGAKEHLPAMGELTYDPHPTQAGYVRSVGYFRVEEVEKVKKAELGPKDHTGEKPDWAKAGATAKQEPKVGEDSTSKSETIPLSSGDAPIPAPASPVAGDTVAISDGEPLNLTDEEHATLSPLESEAAAPIVPEWAVVKGE